MDNLTHHPPTQSQPLQVQMEGALLPNHAPDYQGCGDILGYNGSQGHSGHAHLQRDDKQQVEPYIDHTGKGKEIQRSLGVPLGP